MKGSGKICKFSYEYPKWKILQEENANEVCMKKSENDNFDNVELWDIDGWRRCKVDDSEWFVVS